MVNQQTTVKIAPAIIVKPANNIDSNNIVIS